MSRTFLLVFLTVLITSVMPIRADDRDVEAYPMDKDKYLTLKTTLDAVKSKEGKMTYISGKLLVVDLPKVQKMVREIIDKTATPAVNVTVSVDFQNTAMMRERSLSISGTFRSTRTGGKPKIKGTVVINAKDQKTTQQRNSSMTLMVSSGKAGELWNTKTVLDTAALKRYGLIPVNANQPSQPGVVKRQELPQDFVRAVGSSMWMKPTYLANGLVHIEIFPVVRAEMKDGSEKYFRVSSVKTSVTVQPKRRLFIGGTNNAMRKYFGNLFGASATSKQATDSLSIYVTANVRIMDPANRKKNPPTRPHGHPVWRHFK
jgi:hypothetical protein